MNLDEMRMLEDYAKEIGTESFSLLDLIVSHRRLRDFNKRYTAERNKELADAREWGVRQGMDYVLTGYISLEDLRKMTIKEIVDKYFIAGYGEE